MHFCLLEVVVNLHLFSLWVRVGVDEQRLYIYIKKPMAFDSSVLQLEWERPRICRSHLLISWATQQPLSFFKIFFLFSFGEYFVFFSYFVLFSATNSPILQGFYTYIYIYIYIYFWQLIAPGFISSIQCKK
jgi:hypothetical protein